MIFKTLISYLKAQTTGIKQLQFLNPKPENKSDKELFGSNVCIIWSKQKAQHIQTHMHPNLKCAILWGADKNISVPGTELCWC